MKYTIATATAKAFDNADADAIADGDYIAPATLTINATTPTSILRDLVARTLGWEDRPYDPVENGSMWHCEALSAPFGPTLHKAHWKPDQNANQTLALIANLGITVPAVKDEDELKTYVLIEAAKIGARKLGENS